MSFPFASEHNFGTKALPKALQVVSPAKRLSSSMMVPDISVMMGDFKFLASPMVLGNSDIDLILGMDWVSKHKAHLDCDARQIQLTHSSKDVIVLMLVIIPFNNFLSMRRVSWMTYLRFQSFANIKMSFQKSFQECLRTGQLNSLSILSRARNLFANVLTSLDLKS